VVRFFQDKTVLITGAGRGIGKRLALGFARSKARVGLLARTKAELDLADLEIEHAGGVSLRLRADVRDYRQVATAVERIKSQYGGIHTLICAAGVQGPIGPLADSDPKDWAEVMNTNLLGAVHVCRAVLPSMIEKRQGKIILLVGGGAEQPRPNFSAYAASKAATVRLAETLAEEVRDSNIQINCMDPGPTYTNMTDEIVQAGDLAGSREVQAATEIRGTGGTHPDKQIQLAMFLASDKSNHISGRLISVDDNWKKLENHNLQPNLFTLRRWTKTAALAAT
jgi:NAD(P)-dependent dehydrogenase (short-subunit alcohol dehydrogenase family)